MVSTGTDAPAVTRKTLDRIVHLAHRAGEAIMAHYHEGTTADQKADRSPITAADRAAHSVIVEALEAWWPETPVVSEEGHLPDAAARAAWTRFWLVDPLDGTKEFLNRNGEFTVNIALIQQGEPVLGVVYAPALGLTWFAGRDLGAWRMSQGEEPERITSQPPAPGQPLTVAESRSHPSAALEEYLATLNVGRAGAGGQLPQVLLGGGGQGRPLPPPGPNHGVGRGRGRLRVPEQRTGRPAPVSPVL